MASVDDVAPGADHDGAVGTTTGLDRIERPGCGGPRTVSDGVPDGRCPAIDGVGEVGGGEKMASGWKASSRLHTP